MTSNHEQDAFEHRFERAVNKTHGRSDRGTNPSSRVWKSIRAGLPETRAETADPRAMGVDPVPVSRRTQQQRRESNMDMAMNPEMATRPPQQSHRGLLIWAALALVGVLVASTFFLNGQTPPTDDRNELAWAPGIATPASTPLPQTANSVCSIEPLNADEVLAMVMNPNQGYRRLGSTQAANSDSLWEPAGPIHDAAYWTVNELIPVEDPEVAESLRAMGNDYWMCLQLGTSYQVWNILDPIIVQQIILEEFPVLRSEEQLRTHIETVGPMLFMESGADNFTSLLQFTAGEGVAVAEGNDALLFTHEEISQLPGNGVGIIRISTPGFSSFDYAMYVTEAAPSVWVINSIGTYPMND